MADDAPVEEVPAAAEEEAPVAPVVPTRMDINTAIQKVLQFALINDGLARGLHEAAKALDSKKAHLCLLASDCDVDQYKKLIQALCAEHNIKLITVDSRNMLGQWCGLCKIDKSGEARNIVACSCAVVKVMEECEAWDVVQDHYKANNASD